MKEKIKFKDYPTIHKIVLPAFYGFIALCAVVTGWAIKNNKNIADPASALGTSICIAPLYHTAVRKETRQAKQEQRD